MLQYKEILAFAGWIALACFLALSLWLLIYILLSPSSPTLLPRGGAGLQTGIERFRPDFNHPPSLLPALLFLLPVASLGLGSPPWISLRSSSSGQSNKACLGVSGPVPHVHWCDSCPGTLAFLRKYLSPMRLVLSCTSTVLSALRKPVCSWRTAGSGGRNCRLLLYVYDKIIQLDSNPSAPHTFNKSATLEEALK